MQKVPVAIALASLAAVVAVAKTQQNEKQQSNARPARTTDSHQPIVYTSTKTLLPKDVQERRDAAMVRYGKAEKRARELLDEGQLEAAEKECRRAIGLDIVFGSANTPPSHSTGVRLLGDIQLARGKYREALESYGANSSHSMRHIPGYPEMCIRIAQCYVGLNNSKMALKFYHYATRRHPEWYKNLPGAGNMRSLKASLLLLRGGDSRSSKQALARYQAAEKLAPTNWYIADAIGEMLYEMGRYEEAISYYRRAMQLGGDKVSDVHRTRVEMDDIRQKQNKEKAPK